MLSRLKDAIRQKLHRRYGVDIPPALDRLKASGFSPAHIFDVGAYSGEFAKTCRGIWPKAKLTCFEVLPHKIKELRTWSVADGNAEIVECLLGSEVKSEVSFHQNETASSILDDSHVPSSAPRAFYPMSTIDEMVSKSGMQIPALLKLDVQGYEYEILKGAGRSLEHVEVVLAEVNLLDVYQGVHLLDELIALLRENGFVAYDICGLNRRPLDAALWQADFIFVPKESRLRADKRWSK